MPRSDLRLDILGASFSITADEDAAYLEKIRDQYREVINNTQKLTGLTDPLKTAILSGYLLCDEIYKLRRQGGEKTEDEGWEAEQITLDLIARIDEILENKAGLP